MATNSASNDEHSTGGHSAYLLLAFLSLLNCLNFVDRQLIASFANFIVPELGLSNTQYGLLTGLVFLTFYSLMGLFMGFLADTVNRSRLIAAALAFWSLLTALSGMARGFVSLAIPRALIGVGESALTPAALSLLADKFPASKLGFVSSIYYLGFPLGGGLSFLIASHLGPMIGWRACFYALGGFGVLMALLMLCFKDTARRQQQGAPNLSLRTNLKKIHAHLQNSPALRYALLGSVLANILFGIANFDQLWLVRERGFERAEIAGITGWFFVVAGTSGTVFGAFAVDYGRSRFKIPRVHLIFAVTLALVPLLLAYRLAEPDSAWFWLGFFCTFFYMGFYVGPFFSVIQELASTSLRATMVAFCLLVCNILGLGLGNLACGALIDWLSMQAVVQPYTVALVSMTVLSNAGLVFFYLAGRHMGTSINSS